MNSLLLTAQGTGLASLFPGLFYFFVPGAETKSSFWPMFLQITDNSQCCYLFKASHQDQLGEVSVQLPLKKGNGSRSKAVPSQRQQ